MDETDLAFAGLRRQAELVRDGEVSSRELVETCLRRIERLDGRLNAFRAVFWDRALEEAERVDGGEGGGGGDDQPLRGVPIAVKDNVDVAGDVTTHGTSAYGAPAAEDSEIVRRVRAAGAIVIGRTNVPPLCALPVTESASYGFTRNPWDTTRTPGGSSGGSAAAVAAGLVPAATGSDGGGSIRFPGAFCGLFGLKVQRGRVSLAPLPEHWYGMSVLGWLTRSVGDAALLYDLTQGSAEGDRDGPPPPARAFAEAAASPPEKLRVGLSFTLPPTPGLKLDERVRRGVEETAELLRSLGHEVVERPVEHPPAALPAGTTRIIRGAADEAMSLPRRERLDRRFRRLFGVMRHIPDSAVQRARAAEAAIAEVYNRSWRDCDVLLTPVTVEPPFEVGRWEGRSWPVMFDGAGRAISYTVPWNQTGQPAAAVPAGFTGDGLPLAAQLVARENDEPTLMSLAAQIEAERPWADRRPPVA